MEGGSLTWTTTHLRVRVILAHNGHVQCGMLPIVIWYGMVSLMLIITPNSGYGMAITPNNIIIVHKSDLLPFVFVIRYEYCWIAMHSFQEYSSWVDV